MFSYKIEYLNNKAYHVLNIFGIKFKKRIKDFLFKENLCKKAGIKTILFIRGDGIGDFIFDIPYIRHIKASKKYRDYKIILAGTPSIIELAQKYIPNILDGYFTLDLRKKMIKSLIKKAKKMSFSLIINPTDGKIQTRMETVINAISAKEKICHCGFFSRGDMKKYGEQRIKNIIDNYSKKINTGSNIMLVKDRCKIFFEKLLDEKLPNPELLCEIKGAGVDINSDYIVISPFSNSPIRTYSPDNFAKIADYITSVLKLPVVIVGTEKERKKAEYIKTKCKNSDMVYNIAGIPFSESILYLIRAKMLVANETGTVHIAQNHKVNTVCISNGSYMGTFQPYPKEESYVSYIYPDNIEEYLEKTGDYGWLINYDINKIEPQKVIEKIDEILNKDLAMTY